MLMEQHARELVRMGRQAEWTLAQTEAYAAANVGDVVREAWFMTDVNRLMMAAIHAEDPLPVPYLEPLLACVRAEHARRDAVESPPPELEEVQTRQASRHVHDMIMAMRCEIGVTDAGEDRLPPPNLCANCLDVVRELQSGVVPLQLPPLDAEHGADACPAATLIALQQRMRRMLSLSQPLQAWLDRKGFVLQKKPEDARSMAEATTHTSFRGGNFCVPYEYNHEFFVRMVYGMMRQERYFFIEKRGVGNSATTFKFHIDLDMVQPDSQPANTLYVLRVVRAIQFTLTTLFPNAPFDMLRAYVLFAPAKTRASRASSTSSASSNAPRAAAADASAAAAEASRIADFRTSPQELLDVLCSKRRRGTQDAQEMSYTTHVYFPMLIVTRIVARSIREACIHNLNRLVGSRAAPFNAWNDVFDLSVYEDNGLRMYGSDKWKKVCEECGGARRDREHVCFRCHGAGGHPTDRLYRPRFVLDGVRDAQAEEAWLVSCMDAELMLHTADGPVQYEAAMVEARVHFDRQTCALCEPVAIAPEACSSLTDLVLNMTQHLYHACNWTEMYRVTRNWYYAMMMFSIQVPSLCPPSPGYRARSGLTDISAFTRALDSDRASRAQREIELLSSDAKPTKRALHAVGYDRDRGLQLAAKAEQDFDKAYDLFAGSSAIARSVDEKPSTRRFALVCYLFRHLPTPELKERYGSLTVRRLVTIWEGEASSLIANRSDVTLPALLVNVQGPNSRYCHNIRKEHGSNNIGFLICQRGITQVCYSDKSRPEGACCERVGEHRRFRFSTALSELPAAIAAELFQGLIMFQNSLVRSTVAIAQSLATSAAAATDGQAVERRVLQRFESNSEQMRASGGVAASSANALAAALASAKKARF